MSVLESPYSWVVAVSCSLMYFVMYGLARASGLLFVATLSYYDTNRETASFPFTLACALRYMGGPLAGYLACRCGIRFVILLGCILSVVGVGACFVFNSILMVTVLWGGFYGLGSSFSSSQLPQMNNFYFHKHLTTSNGVSYAGAALAGIVLPPLIEILLNEYGIQGTYLLLSGIALNAIPAGILMKEPHDGTPIKEVKATENKVSNVMKPACIKRISDVILVDDSFGITSRSLKHRTPQAVIKNSALNSNCEQSIPITRSDVFRKSSAFLNHKSETTGNSIFPHEKEEVHESSLNKDILSKTNVTDRKTNSKISIFTKNEALYINDDGSSKDASRKSFSNCNEKCQNISTISQKCKFLLEYLKRKVLPEYKAGTNEIGLRVFDIFFDIKFLLISFTGSINGFFCFVLPTILNDFALDKGISLTDSTFMLMAMSATDLLGRVGFGWVTDNGFMSLANLCAVCFFILALSLAFVVWSSEMIPLFAVLSVMGLCLGVHTPLPACLVTKYIKSDRHIMANASFDIFSVPFLLLTSYMIASMVVTTLSYHRVGPGSNPG